MKWLKNDQSDCLNQDQDSQFVTNKDEDDKINEDASSIDRKITLTVSYMEIYNENVNDLLDSSKKNLDVRENKGEVFVD